MQVITSATARRAARAKRARENSAHVRMLTGERQPEFAASLAAAPFLGS
jgi:hypothetical protein